jgi:hypothetical protein
MGTDRFYKLWTQQSAVQATRVGPGNWGSEERLYSQDVEDAFGKIETRLARLHTKLAYGSQLLEDERYGWAMWLLASYLRTPFAFICSAEVTATMNNVAEDLFRSGYAVLAKCVTDPHCIELITNRQWQVLKSEAPYFLKPDSGVILTDRLDNQEGSILYPLSPFLCFVASGNRASFGRTPVDTKTVFALNNDILRWSDRSVACTTKFWQDEEPLLRKAVKTYLAAGRYAPPTSGRFFSIETVKCDGEIRATILAPRGPVLMTVPESVIRPVDGVERPKVPGLYDLEDCPPVTIGVRYSDDDDEIDYAAAAQLMMKIGQAGFAADCARKALERNSKDLGSKLILLACEPEANVGDLTPESPDDAAKFAIWRALQKREPLEGLKITSSWLRDHPDHEKLIQANFLCAVLTHGARFFRALFGQEEELAYIDNNTPLPDGTVELAKRACLLSTENLVSEVQDQVGKMDLNASGLPADILRLSGLNQKVRLYRVE